jgi:dihydrofolate synthase/folylpolyglutamate synthase
MMNAIVEYLYNIPRFSRNGGLGETQERLRRLGNPEKSFHYIHVAGTNGKGSVCAYMESCLRQMGYKTGLFTSPHLVRINERIRINNEEISDADLAEAFHKVKTLVDEQAAEGIGHPTFFEFIYLMAMCAFEKAGITYGVIETGLGGRLDLTNAVEAPVLTVITSISLDHTAILGDTIGQIAAEKAGIIKPGVPLVYLADGGDAERAIAQKAREMTGSPDTEAERTYAIPEEHLWYPVRPEWMEDASIIGNQIHFYLMCPYFKKYDIILDTTGLYQVENVSLAVTAMEILRRTMGWDIWESRFRRTIMTGIEATVWPGRMELVAPNTYVDGAHNDDAIRKLVYSIVCAFPEKDIYLVFAVAEDKDYRQMVRTLCGLDNLKGVVVTELDNGRRRDYHEVMEHFQDNWHGKIQGTYNVNEAIATGQQWQGQDGILICTGSLYLVGHVKEILGGI